MHMLCPSQPERFARACLTVLPGLSLLCVYPGTASVMDFLLKKDQLLTFAPVFEHSFFCLAGPTGRLRICDQACEEHPHQIFRYFRKLELSFNWMCKCTVLSGQKLSETGATPWLFSSSLQTGFCNLTQRENCCPPKEHIVMPWYSLLLYLVMFLSIEKSGQTSPSKVSILCLDTSHFLPYKSSQGSCIA